MLLLRVPARVVVIACLLHLTLPTQPAAAGSCTYNDGDTGTPRADGVCLPALPEANLCFYSDGAVGLPANATGSPACAGGAAEVCCPPAAVGPDAPASAPCVSQDCDGDVPCEIGGDCFCASYGGVCQIPSPIDFPPGEDPEGATCLGASGLFVGAYCSGDQYCCVPYDDQRCVDPRVGGDCRLGATLGSSCTTIDGEGAVVPGEYLGGMCGGADDRLCCAPKAPSACVPAANATAVQQCSGHGSCTHLGTCECAGGGKYVGETCQLCGLDEYGKYCPVTATDPDTGVESVVGCGDFCTYGIGTCAKNGTGECYKCPPGAVGVGEHCIAEEDVFIHKTVDSSEGGNRAYTNTKVLASTDEVLFCVLSLIHRKECNCARWVGRCQVYRKGGFWYLESYQQGNAQRSDCSATCIRAPPPEVAPRAFSLCDWSVSFGDFDHGRGNAFIGHQNTELGMCILNGAKHQIDNDGRRLEVSSAETYQSVATDMSVSAAPRKLKDDGHHLCELRMPNSLPEYQLHYGSDDNWDNSCYVMCLTSGWVGSAPLLTRHDINDNREVIVGSTRDYLVCYLEKYYRKEYDQEVHAGCGLGVRDDPSAAGGRVWYLKNTEQRSSHGGNSDCRFACLRFPTDPPSGYSLFLDPDGNGPQIRSPQTCPYPLLPTV